MELTSHRASRSGNISPCRAARWNREPAQACTLRTGDGLELEVLLPCGAEYFVQTGDMARAGEPVCRISSEELRREKAVVKVQFTDSSRVTELHVLAGQKRAGAPAAEYSPRNT